MSPRTESQRAASHTEVQETQNPAATACVEDTSSVIFPRRKAGQHKRPSTQAPVVVTVEVLQEVFDMPLWKACKTLGICATAMKKVCRKLGVMKWPYKENHMPGKRKASAPVDSSSDGHESDGVQSDATSPTHKEKLEEVEVKTECSPSTDDDASIAHTPIRSTDYARPSISVDSDDSVEETSMDEDSTVECSPDEYGLGQLSTMESYSDESFQDTWSCQEFKSQVSCGMSSRADNTASTSIAMGVTVGDDEGMETTWMKPDLMSWSDSLYNTSFEFDVCF